MTPAAGRPAIIYTRVSTREQGDSGHGLDAQEAAARVECERRGWPVLEVYREALSGDKAARPLFTEACELAAKHGAILVGAKADRLTRAGVAAMLSLHERAAAEGWHVYALDLPEIDTTSPMGEFILTVIAAINRLERRMIAQRTKDALAQAKLNGTRSGKPIGRPRAMPEGTIERLRQLRAEGLSYDRIAATLNNEGIPGAHGGQWAKRSAYLACRRYL